MKAYVITAATAMSLGYTAGFASDGLVSATTIPEVKRVVVNGDVPLDGVFATNLLASVDSVGCPLVLEKVGLPLDECDVEDGAQINFTVDTEGNLLRFQLGFPFAGNWTRGPAQ